MEALTQLEYMEAAFGYINEHPDHSCLYSAKVICKRLRKLEPRIIWWNINVDPEDIENEGHAYVITNLHGDEDKPLNRRPKDEFTIGSLKAQNTEDLTTFVMNENDNRL